MRLVVICILFLILAGCFGSSESAPNITENRTAPHIVTNFSREIVSPPPANHTILQEEQNLSPVLPVPLQSPIGRYITVDILIDTDATSANDSEISEFFRITNDFLVNKTEIGMNLSRIIHFSYDETSSSAGITGGIGPVTWRPVLDRVYGSTPSAEFIIILEADDVSATYGGYSLQYAKAGQCNRYLLDNESRNRSFAAVLDFHHIYGGCGYDSTDPVHPVHVSDTATDGQCRNKPGTPCIFNESLGYYLCDDAEMLNSLYVQNRYNFVATSAIHELMHGFGRNASADHFGTPECTQLMGSSSYDDGTLNTFQANFGICPYIFEVFKNSYHECD